MNRFSVKCPDCTYPLDAEGYNIPVFQSCKSCKTGVLVYALPALYRRTSKNTETAAAQMEDAACFYHASNKAEEVCGDCGRFLCNLCSLPLDDEILCVSCLELRRKKETGHHTLKPRQLRYDKLAIQLAVLPLLFWPLTFITAPAALFVVLKYWKRKLEFAPHRKTRMVFAFIFALLEIIGWIFYVITIVRVIAHG